MKNRFIKGFATFAISSLFMGTAMADETIVNIDGAVGTYVVADTPATKTVLMLHGYGSSRHEVGDLYTSLANSLEKEGVNSLRIDFRGFGDSPVTSDKASITTMVEDAQNAYQFLVDKGATNIEVQGFSLGGEISILAFSDYKEINKLSLWSTPMQLDELYQGISQQDKATAKEQGKVTLDLGFRKLTVSDQFIESLLQYDVINSFKHYKGDVQFITGETDDKVVTDAPKVLTENNREALAKHIEISKVGHIFGVFSDNDQQQQVILKTVNFLK
ncbi:alpha/beta fold hydrolase [Vibrio sp. SS-MA-C1-2]|uniref:alpha/beta hydrolase n=1 Tax=Vibrio sp. SS-MA-C1-2 TaxID=2908646 RepID=UPI001F20DE2B|nr:alpha/beta fold hydrolase [Vibrio sp. SS-MA-C1-2]UJF17495.1 alpha/beta fold hydrolase [Vibrio sp. SS-MA-C1-2]